MDESPDPRDAMTGRWVSLGLLSGAAIGVVIWMISGYLVFFPIFAGGGLVAGVAIGNSLDKRPPG